MNPSITNHKGWVVCFDIMAVGYPEFRDTDTKVGSLRFRCREIDRDSAVSSATLRAKQVIGDAQLSDPSVTPYLGD